jgi:4a-hydroxytetrahydrobiopterin dehydratase
MARSRLAADEITRRLTEIPGWSVRNDKLHRDYKFADFVDAFGFMTSAALVAERLNHHPEWFNVWNTVIVDLTTHDAGGITDKDFALATAMERIAGGRTTQDRTTQE